ncbi:hypothetical protein K469DRAFT_552286, partial [Zopfia rhizophila CBS 207.26]
TDITLTAYQDTIDYLGYFCDRYRSIVDGISAEDRLSKKVLADQAGKVKRLVQVNILKTYSLFNLEGDDPLDIPEHLS